MHLDNSCGIKPRKNKQGVITSWTITIYSGIDEATGKPIQYYDSIKHQKDWSEKYGFEQAYKKKTVLQEQIKDKHLQPTKLKLEDYIEQWIHRQEIYKNLKQSTLELYKDRARFVNKALGKVKIKDLTAKQINQFYVDLMEGKITGNRITARTVRSFHTLLNKVLDKAYKEHLVSCNEASFVELPRLPKETRRALITRDDYSRIEEALRTESFKWYTLIILDANTGMRRGELLGLKWNKVNFTSKTITIDNQIQRSRESHKLYESQPKSMKSNRTISIAQPLVDLLKRYKAYQAEERLKLGGYYKDQGFIFTQTNGVPISPEGLNNFCIKLSKKIGIKFTPHSLRYYLASLGASENIPIATISKMLGHSSTSTTLNSYVHAFDEDDAKLVSIIENNMSKAKE